MEVVHNDGCELNEHRWGLGSRGVTATLKFDAVLQESSGAPPGGAATLRKLNVPIKWIQC